MDCLNLIFIFLQMDYSIVTRVTLFMIYTKWKKHQRALGVYITSWANVTKSKGGTEFKTKQTENADTERKKN